MNSYEQGQMAKFDGQPKKNPYSMFSELRQYENWDRGYDDGGWNPEV